MHTVSETFQELYDGLHTLRPVVELETVENGQIVYREFEVNRLYSVKTSGSLFPNSSPSIGNFCAREATVVLKPPEGMVVPRMARIRLFVYLTDGTVTSERVPKGVYYIDTRSYNASRSKMTMYAYDAALKFDADFNSSELAWPAKAEDVVVAIAESVGVSLASRVIPYIQSFLERDVPLVTSMTKREVLCGIATMFCANWTMTDSGELDLIPLNTSPEVSDTVFLADEYDNRILIGGDRIIVR